MGLALLMTLAAAIYRLAPHPLNIAPLGAMALLGGMYFGRRYALWVPVLALAMTDLVLNTRMGYPVIYWPRGFDYAAFVLIGLLGLWHRSQRRPGKLGAAAITPFVFFLISNFGVWLCGLNLANVPYTKSVTGLVECYAAGLPFLSGTMIGDWAFMAVFAGTLAWARRSAGERAGWLVATTEA